MLVSFARRLRPLMRGYGWEDPKERFTKNWWQYGDSDYTGDATPEERGYQVDHWERRTNEMWKKEVRMGQNKRIGEGGTDPNQIIDMELGENPLGDYDANEKLIPKSQVRTRIIHLLRHFQKVDLRKLNWDSNMLKDLKLDEFERIALLTSIEAEFETIFEDNVFDNMKTLNDAVNYIASDRYVY